MTTDSSPSPGQISTTCAVPGCQNAMRDRFVLCVEHWEMCPEEAREAMRLAYRSTAFATAKSAAMAAITAVLADRAAVATG